VAVLATCSGGGLVLGIFVGGKLTYEDLNEGACHQRLSKVSMLAVLFLEYSSI